MMTIVNQAAATKRFQQGLRHLFEKGQDDMDDASLLAVVTVMAYIGAYAFPDENLHGLKQQLIAVLQPVRMPTEIEVIVGKALALAEVFRRPWSEPVATPEPTIGNQIVGNITSRNALDLIEQWAQLNRAALEANWSKIQSGHPLDRIPPLE